jgi:hypothetical protein
MRFATCVLALSLMGAAGCSRRCDRTSDASLDDELVAAAKNEVLAASSTDPRATVEFARRLAHLTHRAEHYELHGYFEHAIAARETIALELGQHFGIDSWEARSARVVLQRERHRWHLNSLERAASDLADAHEQQARDQWQDGEYNKALEQLAAAYEIAAQVWGPECYVVANLIEQQARWQMHLGDLAAAAESLRQVINIREEEFSRAHPDTLSSISALGLVLQAADRTDEAEPLLRQAADLAQQLWGAKHPEYATHIGNLALLLHETGQDVEALSLAEQVVAIEQATANPDDHHVRDAQALIAAVRSKTAPQELHDAATINTPPATDRAGRRSSAPTTVH